eukprot:3715561-Amphidinium_carterae.1
MPNEPLPFAKGVVCKVIHGMTCVPTASGNRIAGCAPPMFCSSTAPTSTPLRSSAKRSNMCLVKLCTRQASITSKHYQSHPSLQQQVERARSHQGGAGTRVTGNRMHDSWKLLQTNKTGSAWQKCFLMWSASWCLYDLGAPRLSFGRVATEAAVDRRQESWQKSAQSWARQSLAFSAPSLSSPTASKS